MNKIFDFTKQVFSGKTISRILFNWQVEKNCRDLRGVCVDLAFGKNPSYQRYWKLNCDKLFRSEYSNENNPDIVINLNEKIPLTDNFADNSFLFNTLYILKEPEDVLKEIFRILKPRGAFFLSTPFIANEMREPADFFRFTSQKLEKMLKEAGFCEIKIIPYGERFSAAAYLLHNFFFFNTVRFFVFSFVLWFDKLIPKKIKNNHPAPIGYFVIARK